MGLIGLGVAYALVPPRPASRSTGIRSIERLGSFGRLFGHAYYYDDGISRLVDGPLRGFADWLAGSSTPRIIDGAVNGVGWLVRETERGFRTVADRPRPQLRARDRARHRSRCSLYLLLWAAR